MYLIGDTHGLRPVFSIVDRLKLEDQNLIHVGDLGLGFISIEQDLKNLKTMDEMLLETNNNLYVIRGNHDNPIFWDKSKGLNLPKLHNLHLMDDFTIKRIEDKNVLFAGGATSIDRIPRKDDVPYPSWWKDEVFKYDEIKLEKAINIHKKVNIVVTHSCPSYVYPYTDNVDIVNHYHDLEMSYGVNLKQELEAERLELSRFYDDLYIHYKQDMTHWFYGHFHSSKDTKYNSTLFKLLNINEVYELE